MKKICLYAVLCAMLLSGCGIFAVTTTKDPEPTPAPSQEQPAVADKPEEAPEEALEEASATEEVTIYRADENVEYVIPVTATVPLEGDRAEALVTVLVTEGALPEGSAVLSWDESTGALDMNDAYGAAVSSTGTTGELMWTGSLINTFMENYDVAEIMLTVEGGILETGHSIYDAPFTDMLVLTPEG